MMLSRLFVQLLNLARRTNTAVDLSPLEGRSFVLSIDELPQDIAIMVENQQITVLPETQIPTADVTISGNVKAIIAMIQDTDDGLDSDELYIAGKMNTAKRFQTFLASLSVDWENFLGQFLPADIAQKGAAVIEQSIHFTKGGMEQLSQSLQHYLLHDKKILLTQAELQHFSKDVAAIHQRLDDWIAQLSSRLATSESTAD